VDTDSGATTQTQPGSVAVRGPGAIEGGSESFDDEEYQIPPIIPPAETDGATESDFTDSITLSRPQDSSSALLFKAELVDEEEVRQRILREAVPTEAEVVDETEAKKRERRRMLLLALAVIVSIAAVAGGIAGSQKSSRSSPENAASTRPSKSPSMAPSPAPSSERRNDDCLEAKQLEFRNIEVDENSLANATNDLDDIECIDEG